MFTGIQIRIDGKSSCRIEKYKKNSLYSDKEVLIREHIQLIDQGYHRKRCLLNTKT